MDKKVQQRPPGMELFFAPLLVTLDPNSCERIKFAYVISKGGSAKKLRDDGSRAFDHPKGSAWIYVYELGGRNPDIIVLLLLHDVEEDDDIMWPYRMSLNFGVKMALSLRAITKLQQGKETTEEYLLRIIADGTETITAKLCERLHNLRTLAGCIQDKQDHCIAETRQYHLPMLVPALRAYGGEWAILADALEIKINEVLSQYP